MAIIGPISSIQKHLNVEKKYLDIIVTYIYQALGDKSIINNRILNLPIGSFDKVNLSDEIFALEQVFFTKNRDECFFESHKKYTDLQLIIDGEEMMEYSDIGKLNTQVEYDKETDFIIYDTPASNETSKILLKNNDIAIYFPNDGHMGLSKSTNVSIVYKTVIKVPCVLWNI